MREFEVQRKREKEMFFFFSFGVQRRTRGMVWVGSPRACWESGNGFFLIQAVSLFIPATHISGFAPSWQLITLYGTTYIYLL